MTGGTPGMLRAGGEPVGEVQVTVHVAEVDAMRPLGFGVTSADGTFHLVLNEARGPLVLPAGQYRFTLESAGSPVQIPREFAQADTTPLAVSWSPDDGPLKLEIPGRLIVQ